MASRAQLEAWADQAARAQGVDPRLFRALIQAESGWNPSAGSPVGARGLTQLMPATGRSLGVTNPLDPRQNLMGGAKYLRRQLDAFGGDPRKALAAYNAGPGAVSKYGGIPPYAETQAYVAKIMGSLGNGPLNPTTPAASDGGGSLAAGGAPMGAATGDPMQMLSALRSMHAATPILARGLRPSEGATRLAGLQLLRSQMSAPAAVGQTESAPAVNLGGGTWANPTGGFGKLIGTPHSGTHTLGNWQSDNAIDIGLKAGSPIYATSDGVIGSRFGSLGANSGSRFAGYRLTLDAPGNATDWWYGHLSKYAPGIAPGVKVRKGQVIGYSGTANGVQHLHLGASSGNPVQMLGLR